MVEPTESMVDAAFQAYWDRKPTDPADVREWMWGILRAALASQDAEEPEAEWEYRTLLDGVDPQPHGRLSRGEITPAEWFASRNDPRDITLERRTPSVPAGPWVPVEQGEVDG